MRGHAKSNHPVYTDKRRMSSRSRRMTLICDVSLETQLRTLFLDSCLRLRRTFVNGAAVPSHFALQALSRPSVTSNKSDDRAVEAKWRADQHGEAFPQKKNPIQSVRALHVDLKRNICPETNLCSLALLKRTSRLQRSKSLDEISPSSGAYFTCVLSADHEYGVLS